MYCVLRELASEESRGLNHPWHQRAKGPLHGNGIKWFLQLRGQLSNFGVLCVPGLLPALAEEVKRLQFE